MVFSFFFLCKINVRHGRPRHPQSQGQIERVNQTISRTLTKLLWVEQSKTQRVNWISILHPTVIKYNTREHAAHGKTPFEVFFGRQPKGVFQTYRPALLDDEIEIGDESPAEPNAGALEQQSKSVSEVWNIANVALDRYRKKKVISFFFIFEIGLRQSVKLNYNFEFLIELEAERPSSQK